MSIDTKKNLQQIIDSGSLEQISDVLSYQKRKNRTSQDHLNRTHHSMDFSRLSHDRPSNQQLSQQIPNTQDNLRSFPQNQPIGKNPTFDTHHDESYDQFNNDFDIDDYQKRVSQLNDIIHEYQLSKYDQQLDDQLFIKGSSRHSSKLRLNLSQQQQKLNKNLSHLLTINNQNKATTSIKNNQFLILLQFEKIYMFLIGTSQSFSFFNISSYQQSTSPHSVIDDDDQFFDQINHRNKNQVINQQYFDLQSQMQFTLNKQQFQNKNSSIKESAIQHYHSFQDTHFSSLQQNFQLSQQQKNIPTFSPFLQTQLEEPDNLGDSNSTSKLHKDTKPEINLFNFPTPPQDGQQSRSTTQNKSPPPSKHSGSHFFKPANFFQSPAFKQQQLNNQSSVNSFINYLHQINISTLSQWKLLFTSRFLGIPLIFQTLWPIIITSIFFLNFISALVKLGSTQISISLTSSDSLSFNLVISLIILFGRQLIYQYFLFINNSQDKLTSIFFQLQKEQLYFYKSSHYSSFFKDYLLLVIYAILIGGINISRFFTIWYAPRLSSYTQSVLKYSIYSKRIFIPLHTQKHFYVIISCFESLRQVSIIRMICIHILNMDHVIENYKQVLSKDFVTTIKCQLQYPLIRTMQNKEIFYKILRYQRKVQDIINPLVTTIFLSSFVLILLTIYQLTFFTRSDNGSSSFDSLVGGISQLILTIFYFINLFTLFSAGNKCNQNIDYIIEQILNPNNFIINQDNLSTKIDIIIMSQQLKSSDYGFQVQGNKISYGYLLGFIIGIIAYALTLITINL